MARRLGPMATLYGCLLSIASFCFLPFLVYTPYTFTGFQLLFLGPLIPLPHSHSVVAPGLLLNDPFVVQLTLPLVLMGLLAVAGLWPNQRLAKIMAWMVIMGVGLTFFCSLCNLASNVASSIDIIDAHGNTLRGITHGSLFTISWLGIWLGMIIAFIGSVITLRSPD